MLLSVTVAAIVVAQDWRHIHLRSAAALVAGSLFGIPLGLLVLGNHHQQLVRAGLGLFILLFALFSLFGRHAVYLEHEHRPLLLFTGFVAGILGGAYGINGPPLAVYGAMRRWSPQHFRATLQAYFLPASALGMIGYWATGMWTRTVTLDYLYCLPVALPAIFIGRAVNRRLNPGAYLKYVHLALALIGGVLLVEALQRHF